MSYPSSQQQSNRTATPVAARGGNDRRRMRLRVLVAETTRGPIHRWLSQQFHARHCTLDVERVSASSLRRRLASDKPIDLVVLDLDCARRAGLEALAGRANQTRRLETLVLASEGDFDTAVRAMQLGAVDFLTKPIDWQRLERRVRQCISRRRYEKAQRRRTRHLRRTCRKLSQANVEVSEQVDVLCQDLVTAYQDLASQMQQTLSTHHYADIVADELDLQDVLRKTLDYLIDHLGPSNAAVLLPASMDEFTIGGYVDLEQNDAAAGLTLHPLADHLAPRLADSEHNLLHLQDREQIAEWVGEDAVGFDNSELIALACRHENETLAIVVLHRHRDEPFTSTMVELCQNVAPVLGEALLRLIRIHHRHL